jgi:DNA-binding GntR family transcriptional regulator
VITRNEEDTLLNLDLDRSKSLKAKVTERLRRAILDAELELGQALSEDKLATALGVSRTPVRDALTTLQRQGLVEVHPQRGSFVFFPSEADIAELCEFREMMETRAFALCYARRRDATLSEMKRASEDMETAVHKGDYVDASRFDERFHNALFDNCENKYLVESYKLVSGQVDALRGYLGETDIDRAMNEHRCIIEAVVNDDLGRAKKTLSEHILKLEALYVSAIRARNRSNSGQSHRQPLAAMALSND